MTRRMYDAVNPWAIPSSAPMVAGYVDCAYAWTAAGWARFPNAVKVRIAAGCNPQDAQVADVETGDYLPWEAVDFVLAQRAKGIDPTVYVNGSNWAPTQTEFRLRGVSEPHWWLALYDGVAVLPAGVVAKQYINPPGSGGNFDLSVVADFWPGVDSTSGPRSDTLGGVATADDIMAELNIIHQGLFGADAAVVKPPLQDQIAMLYTQLKTPATPGGVADLLLSRTQAILDNIAKLTATAPGAGLSTFQNQLLQEAHDAIARVEAALKGA